MLEAVALGLDASPGLISHSRIPVDPSSSRNTFNPEAQLKTPTRVLSSVNNEAEEELVWSGRTVTWSRGCQVYRKYSYDHDKEDVAYAVFAHFQRGTDQVAGRFTKGKGKEEATARLNQTFGPFHTAHTYRWGQSIPSSSVKGLRLERALMIFLATKAYIYFPSGEEIIVHLPFVVEKAWPISTGGVIVQRRLQKREIRRKQRQSGSVLRGMDLDIGSTSVLDNLVDMEDEGEDLPRVWALERPLEEFKMVTEAGNGFSIPYSSELLMVGPEPGSLVVTHDTEKNQVVFYRRSTASKIPSTTQPPLTARTMRPEDVMRQPEPLPKSGRASLGRNPSTALSRTDRRQSGKADPLERTTRRAPRLSRTAGPDKDLPVGSAAGELHATLDPPPFAVTVNQPARKGGRVVSGASSVGVDKSDRRGSGAFMREEIPPIDKRGLFAIGEKDLRETTMLMGLERPAQTLKSDITLERMTWDTPPSDSRGVIPQVFTSENLWPVSVCVDVQYRSELACFKFTPTSCEVMRRIPCTSAVPVISTRPGIHDLLILGTDGSMRIHTAGGREVAVNPPRHLNNTHDEVVRRMASSLSMQVDSDDPMGSRARDRRIVGLKYPAGSRVSIGYDDGETARVSFDFTIKDRLVKQCSEALACVLHPPDYFIFQRELITRLQSGLRLDPLSAWDIFLTTIRDLLQMQRGQSVSKDFAALLAKAQQSSRPLLRRLGRQIELPQSIQHTINPPLCGEHLDSALSPLVLFALHMVAQDRRCLAATQGDLRLLGPLLSDLAGSLALVGWWDYWMRLVPYSRAVLQENSEIDCSALAAFESPPDVIQHYTTSLTRKPKPFPIPVPIDGNDLGNIRPFETLEILCDIYSKLSGNTAGLALFKAHETMKKIHRRGLPSSWIQTLSPGVMTPIIDALRICQNHIDTAWTPEFFKFIGRMDVAAKTEHVAADEVIPVNVPEGHPTIGDLMTIEPTTVKRLPDVNLPHVRFGSDRRVAEVERILQTTRVRTISIEDPKGYSEQDILHYHQTVVNTIAIRTLAVICGSGIFEYGTRRTTVTETWDVPPIELSIKVLPSNSVIKAQLVAENADWPCFHNGVSAALAISPDCKGIDSSWIVFNRPATLNPEHGGLLLGLGLNGHLRNLMAYHAFPYMEPRHDFTSCGLLLGLACSFAGSQDPLCTKVLSLHTHALLPMGSAELNASPIIQSSALLGLGLVHAGSRNLRMAEVALSEVGRNELPGVDLFEGYQESYSFSASMAFGLIMLGRGGKQSSEVDRRLSAKLRRCILGDPTDNTSNAIDTTMTSPGATLALGLMYLKTGHWEVADMLEIPKSAFEADHVRPDILLIRVLARSLIMWNHITASLNWIESNLPPFLRKGHSNHRKTSSMEIASELAYFNIIAGACLAIGLKFAGTGSELAHNNLLFFFGVLLKASCSSSMTYEGKIRRQAARQCLNVVTLALATVMSGTGELNVLRRLRVSHGQEGAGVTYGSHMATHMACGILFLGRGHYTLGNSNLAIAAMCISFFPRFQSSPSDNKAYPQAFRHLWALAAEPRCLVAKDIDTRETVYMPLRMKVQGPQAPYTARLISPTLIAPYEMISMIGNDTPRYWAVGYDLTVPADKEALVKTRTLYVKRRAAYLDYNTDPKGNRSMVITAGSISGLDHFYDLLAAAEPMSLPAHDVEQIIKTHAGTPDLVAMVQSFSTDAKFDKFIRNVLLECVSMDKTNLIGTYISMWLALKDQDDLKAEHIAHLTMMRDFYSPAVFTHFSMPSDKRLGWIRPNFVISASRKISDGEISESTVQDYFNDERWTPDIAIYLIRNHVPPLDFLRAIKMRVRSWPEGVELEEMRTKVRDVARIYAQTVQRQYIADGEEAVGEIKLWKSESIDDALRSWRTLA